MGIDYIWLCQAFHRLGVEFAAIGESSQSPQPGLPKFILQLRLQMCCILGSSLQRFSLDEVP